MIRLGIGIIFVGLVAVWLPVSSDWFGLNGLIIIGSNWGGEKTPAWVYNLRAATPGQVEMSVYGARLAVEVEELSDADRESAWAAAVRVWPNYEIYAARTTRQLPIFHLTPRL